MWMYRSHAVGEAVAASRAVSGAGVDPALAQPAIITVATMAVTAIDVLVRATCT